MSERRRILGLLSGPIIAVAIYLLLPDSYVDSTGDSIELSHAARSAAAVAVWMATWWITEAISVFATALIPLVAFPLFGTATIKQAAAPYGHDLIYLFLGGFILALALERCGLHRRFALTALMVVGARPTRIVGAFMFIAAFVSMWVTNTATTIMLLPVALSIIKLVDQSAGESVDDESAAQKQSNGRHCAGHVSNFAPCLLLAIAYAASIGGMGTIIGTAPNLFLVSYIQSQMGREISFVAWMSFALPLVVVFLPIVWWFLSRVVYRVSNRSIEGIDILLTHLHDELGTMTRAEKLTLTIFLLTALAWVTRPLLVGWQIGSMQPFAGVTDTVIAVAAALALFVTPVDARKGEFLMDWDTAVRLPWGLLLLFGGGLSLAATLDGSGFSAYLGSRAVVLAGLPTMLIVALVTAAVIFLTEMTSNMATTATLIPVFYAVAVGLGLEPLLLMVPACIAASCAFMLPVATPPNAVVYGSGRVTIPQMSRAGFWLNLIAIILIPLLTWIVILPVLGVTL